MNTYAKYIPNVFLAKCDEKHYRGEEITVQTKYGKENKCTVFNLILEKQGFFYYSIVRSDGFNQQEFAKNRAERLEKASVNAENKSTEYWKASNEGADFLRLAEPIKIGHHSEKRHRALIERNHNRMNKCVEFSKKAESYESRIAYWESKSNVINLSMPESIEFYEFEVERCKMKHEQLKSGEIERSHSFSLTYAKKDLNNALNNFKLSKLLWE